MNAFATQAPAQLHRDCLASWYVVCHPLRVSLCGLLFCLLSLGISHGGPADLDFTYYAKLLPENARSITVAPDGSVLAGQGNLIRLLPDGIRDTNFHAAPEAWEVVGIQDNGAILVVGQSGYNLNHLLLRLHADGRVDTAFQPSWFGVGTNTYPYASIRDVAFQSDGKVVVAGYFTTVNGSFQLHLARLNVDGTLDLSYRPDVGTNGLSQVVVEKDDLAIVVLNPGPLLSAMRLWRFTSNGGKRDSSYEVILSDPFNVDSLARLHLQSDGKLLLGGAFSMINGIPVSGIARLNSDGSLDANFQSALDPNSRVISFAQQNDGKIVICRSLVVGVRRPQLVRLNLDGSIDPSFDFDQWLTGTVEYPIIGKVAVQPGGRILVSGNFTHMGANYWPGLAALQGGEAVPSLPLITLQPESQTVQPGSDSIFRVSVRSFTPPSYQWQFEAIDISGATNHTLILTNLQPSQRGKYRVRIDNAAGSTLSIAATLDIVTQPGAIDATFKPEVMLYSRVGIWGPDPVNGPAFAMVRQTNGLIVVGGEFYSVSSPPKNYLVRFEASGRLDTRFNSGLGPDGPVNALAMQSDGKLIIGGAFSSYDGIPFPGISRLLPDSMLDTNFVPQAISKTPITALLVLADGKIVVAGSFSNGVDGTTRQLVRLEPEGSIDPTFSQTPNALRRIPFRRQQLAAQTDGKILAVDDNSLVRLNTDGSLDESFTPPSFRTGLISWYPPQVKAMTMGAGGKILVGGNIFIARLNPNGTPDESFTPPNLPIDDWINYRPFVSSVAEMSNGDILIGGVFTNISGQSRDNLARLKPDGSLDLGFDAPSTNRALVDAIIEISPGLIMIGGASANTAWLNRIHAGLSLPGSPQILSHPQNMVVKVGERADFSVNAYSSLPIRYQWRFNGNVIAGATNRILSINNALLANAGDYQVIASNDLGSTSSGIALLTLQNRLHAGMRDVTFAPSLLESTCGLIALPGGQVITVTEGKDLALVRINPDGSIDSAFKCEISGFSHPMINTLSRQPDGKLLVGGWFDKVNGVNRNSVARILADGSLDLDFDAGTGPSDPIASSIPVINHIIVQSNRCILLVGYFSRFSGTPRVGIARLYPNGSLDESFDPGEWIGHGFPPTFLKCVAEQFDGRVLLGGQFPTATTLPLRNLARFLADGTPDLSFDTGTGPNNMVDFIALHENGKILIAGGFSAVNGKSRNHVARLESDGRLDSTFIPDWTLPVDALAVQADGKIIIGGYDGRSSLVRLNADGTRDRSFISEWDVFSTAPNSSVRGFVPDGLGHLIVNVTMNSEYDMPFRIMRLFLETPVIDLRMLSPRVLQDNFSVLLSTVPEQRYIVERTESFNDTNWIASPLLEGTGTTIRWVDLNSPVAQGLYRLRIEPK